MNLSLKPVLTGYSALSIAAVTVFALTIAAVAATADGQALPAPGPGSELGVMLQAGANDLCVDNAGSVRPGTALQGWKCSPRNLNQRFERVRRGKNLAAFRNKLSGLCIDAGNGTKNNGKKKTGAAVFQAPCAERASQALKIRPLSANGNNMHFKIHAGHSDLCLQLTGDAKHGSRLIQARCDSKKTNQKFSFRR